MKKNTILILYTIVLVLVVGTLSSGVTMLLLTGQRVEQGDQVLISKADFEQLRTFQKLNDLKSYIQQLYIEDVDDQTLMTGAAKGLFRSLGDPYSYYLDAEQTAAASAQETGIYQGIGCQLIIDPNDFMIMVTRVYQDSPAQKAGIVPGDKIVKVFGEDVTGYELADAVSRMRGEPGTAAELTILRNGELIDLSMDRAEVTVNRVETRMLQDGIALVTIYEFEGDALKGFKEAIATLEKNKATGMIIDLRGNPGGNLEIVNGICDLLLPEGVIVSVVDKYDKKQEYKSDPAMFSIPMAVLVNGMSASASEIMAACIKDYSIGKVIGTQTFGKGIVQSYYVFKDDNSAMSLTTAKYYTPKGEWIHKVGVAPDIVVELPEEIQKDMTKLNDTTDTQLLAAIEAVKADIAAAAK